MLAMFVFGNYWWFFLPGLLLGIYAQFKLTSCYNHYLQVPAQNGLTGAEAAREILDDAGLQDVPVEEIPGELTDHYDPTKRALFLSTGNYHGQSLAAQGVAAHEAGHALQQKAAYALLDLRMALVPVASFASQAAVFISFFGFFLGVAKFITLGIIVFAIITVFQLITLPVEFNASSRAKEHLFKLGLIRGDEREGVSEVLNAAALTYVAAMVASLLTLLQFVMMARDRRD